MEEGEKGDGSPAVGLDWKTVGWTGNPEGRETSRVFMNPTGRRRQGVVVRVGGRGLAVSFELVGRPRAENSEAVEDADQDGGRSFR